MMTVPETRADRGRTFSVAAGACLLAIFPYLPWNDGAMAAHAVFILHGVLVLLAASVCSGGSFTPVRWSAASPVGVSLAVLGAVSATRVIVQTDPYGGWLRIIDYAAFGCFYLLHASRMRRKPGWSRLASGWLLAAVIMAAGAGLIEQFSSDPLRVSGPFRDPNHLASFIVIGLGLTIGRLFFSGTASKEGSATSKAGSRAALVLIATLLLWVLLLSGSRGGVLAFLGLLTAVLISPGKVHIPDGGNRRSGLPWGGRPLTTRGWAMAFLILVLILFFVVPNPFRTYLTEDLSQDPYAYERLGIWRMGLEMIAANPLTGVGLGNFRLHAPVHNFPVEHSVARFGRIPYQAHNVVLQLVAEGGIIIIPALAGLGWAVASAFIRYGRSRRKKRDDPVTAGALLALLGITVQSMVSNNLENNAIVFSSLFLLACISRMWSGPPPPSSQDCVPAGGSPASAGKGKSVARSVCVIPLLAVLFYAAIWIPYYGDRLARLAEEHLGRGETAAAAGLLERAIALVPLHSYYPARLADLHAERYQATKDFEAFSRAESLYFQALERNPSEHTFHFRLAVLYDSLSQVPGPWTGWARLSARKRCHRTLALHPHQFIAYLLLARLYQQAGDLEGSERALESCLVEEPNCVRGHLRLASIQESMGNGKMASAHRDQAEAILARHGTPGPGVEPYIRELLRRSGGP